MELEKKQRLQRREKNIEKEKEGRQDSKKKNS